MPKISIDTFSGDGPVVINTEDIPVEEIIRWYLPSAHPSIDKARFNVYVPGPEGSSFPNEDYENEAATELVHTGTDTASRTHSQISNARVYLHPGQDAPEGATIKIGNRGGRYYETTPRRGKPDKEVGEEIARWRRSKYVQQWKYEIAKRLGKDLRDAFSSVNPEDVLEIIWSYADFGERYEDYWNDLDGWEKIASGLIHTWAASSSDHNFISLSLQKMAADVFGVELESNFLSLLPSRMEEFLWEEVDGWRMRDILSRALRSVYEETQAELQTRGIDEILLFRGMRWGSSVDQDKVPQWVKDGWAGADTDFHPGYEFSSKHGDSWKIVDEFPFGVGDMWSDGDKVIEFTNLFGPVEKIFTWDSDDPLVTPQTIAKIRDRYYLLDEGREISFSSFSSLLDWRKPDSVTNTENEYMASYTEYDPQRRYDSLILKKGMALASDFSKRVAGLKKGRTSGNEYYLVDRVTPDGYVVRQPDTKSKLSSNVIMEFANEEDVEIGMNPLSSFSASPATAAVFASQWLAKTNSLVYARVPREQILSNFATGWGCADETEFVVIGHPIQGKALFQNSYPDSLEDYVKEEAAA